MNRRNLLISTVGVLATTAARAQSFPVMPPSPKPFGVFAEHGALTD